MSASSADPRQRSSVTIGTVVDIVTKENQRRGTPVRGTVQDILTNSSFHPHGIKVRLRDGKIGRVKSILKDP